MFIPKINKLYTINSDIVILRGMTKDRLAGVFEYIDPHFSLHDGHVIDYWYDDKGNNIAHNRNIYINKYYYKAFSKISELTDLQSLKGHPVAIIVHSKEEWDFLLQYFKCSLPNHFIDNQTNLFDLKKVGYYWYKGELTEEQKKEYSILDIYDIFPYLNSFKTIDELLNLIEKHENNK